MKVYPENAKYDGGVRFYTKYMIDPICRFFVLNYKRTHDRLDIHKLLPLPSPPRLGGRGLPASGGTVRDQGLA